MTRPRALSLFSGIGLHDLGLARTGWEIAAQVEIEPWCRAVLDKHWPGLTRWKDVRDVTAESVRSLGSIDLVTGGFPCPDISTAGKGVGLLRGERSGLWLEMLRIIRIVKPAWVLAENVPALYSRGIDSVLSGLEEAGYTSWPVVVGAWAVGAPHRRERVWIVGRRVENPESGRWGAPWPPRATEGRADAALGDADRCGAEHLGDADSPGLEGSGTDAHEGRPGSGVGCPGVGDAQGLRCGEGPGREALTGVEPAGRSMSRGARESRMADPAEGGCRTGQRDHDARESDAVGCRSGMADANGPGLALNPGQSGDARPERPPALGDGRAGVADAKRDALRQLQQREPEGRLPGGVCDEGETESGGMRARAWPAGRNEPQHPWEPPRLVFPGGVASWTGAEGRTPEPGLGRGADGSPAGVDVPPGGDQPRALRAESRYASWCRRERLKAIGNANPPDAPEILGRWMLQNFPLVLDKPP